MNFQKINNQELFVKRVVTDLNDAEMSSVDGGTSPVCGAAAASSLNCVRLVGAVIGGGYALYRYYTQEAIDESN